MKNNVKSAKISELHDKSTPPKNRKPILQNFPRFFQGISGCCSRGVSGALFFHIFWLYT